MADHLNRIEEHAKVINDLARERDEIVKRGNARINEINVEIARREGAIMELRSQSTESPAEPVPLAKKGRRRA